MQNEMLYMTGIMLRKGRKGGRRPGQQIFSAGEKPRTRRTHIFESEGRTRVLNSEKEEARKG